MAQMRIDSLMANMNMRHCVFLTVLICVRMGSCQ